MWVADDLRGLQRVTCFNGISEQVSIVFPSLHTFRGSNVKFERLRENSTKKGDKQDRLD